VSTKGKGNRPLRKNAGAPVSFADSSPQLRGRSLDSGKRGNRKRIIIKGKVVRQ